jgi:GrpB-like predicted nucleotidyltransferase (UPF0157 family)
VAALGATVPSIYSFVDPSPAWPAAFKQEAARLKDLLGEEVLVIHHIGSTSVPGLAAKPIIDLLPVVRSIDQVDAATGALEAAGYHAWGAFGLEGRRLFTKDAAGVRTHNVHIYGHDDPDIRRHLAFRSYLRAHPDQVAAYARVKGEAYARHPADIAQYNDAKSSWIRTTEQVALRWYDTAATES